ncbi:MAG: NADPH-dependent oxidoreductase [Marinilabiliales bacterium]|nr:MAG: NADPH-dependent oxidoreductase [Marinilabiliales bacterium]
MNAIETIMAHRSIRKYKSDPISDNILDEILVAASRAGTTGNMQVYSIVVTRDQQVKDALLPLHFGQEMISKAPAVLTFCADFNRFNKWCDQRNAGPGYDNFLSFMTASIDALLASQNAVIAAEANGLGTCYLGTTTYTAGKIIEVLNLPKGVVPITTVVLGYPDENPGLTDRLPMRAIVHHEKYSDFSKEDIELLYAEKENMEVYKGFVKESEVENLAQVFTQKRYTKKDNVLFSKTLLDVLTQQGFMNNE